MVKKTVKSASASTDKAVRKAGGAPAVNIGISEKDRAAIASGLCICWPTPTRCI